MSAECLFSIYNQRFTALSANSQGDSLYSRRMSFARRNLAALHNEIDCRRHGACVVNLAGWWSAGRLGRAAGSTSRCWLNPAEYHRRTKMRRRQFIEMPFDLLLQLVGGLMRILTHACLVDIATVHTNKAVDDLHRTAPTNNPKWHM